MEIFTLSSYGLGSSSPTAQSRWGFPGGGFALTRLLTNRSQIEFGGFLITSQFNYGSQAVRNVKSSASLGFRYLLTRFFFINTGIFTNYYIRNPQNFKGADWGPYGGLGVRFPLNRSAAFIVTGQYRYSTHSMTSGAKKINPTEGLVILGLSVKTNTGRSKHE